MIALKIENKTAGNDELFKDEIILLFRTRSESALRLPIVLSHSAAQWLLLCQQDRCHSCPSTNINFFLLSL